MRYYGNIVLDFHKNSLFVEKFLRNQFFHNCLPQFYILTQQMRYYGNIVLDFHKNSLFVEKFLRNQFLTIVCLNFIFSTIFVVNNGHRAIKLYINCRAGATHRRRYGVNITILEFNSKPSLCHVVYVSVYMYTYVYRYAISYADGISF